MLVGSEGSILRSVLGKCLPVSLWTSPLPCFLYSLLLELLWNGVSLHFPCLIGLIFPSLRLPAAQLLKSPSDVLSSTVSDLLPNLNFWKIPATLFFTLRSSISLFLKSTCDLLIGSCFFVVASVSFDLFHYFNSACFSLSDGPVFPNSWSVLSLTCCLTPPHGGLFSRVVCNFLLWAPLRSVWNVSFLSFSCGSSFCSGLEKYLQGARFLFGF